MKRFDGIILCSDVDGTLIDETNIVPKENIEAISYFQAHGGKFFLATGRIPEAVPPALCGLMPDLPCICHNGGSIYDFRNNTYVATTPVSRAAIAPIEEMLERFPNSGLEVITDEGIFVVRRTHATDRHTTFEKITSKPANSCMDVSGDWLKIVFAQEPEETELIQQAMADSLYHKDFSLMRTHKYYYEIFDKCANKGNALLKLCSICGIDPKQVIAIGDNDNDVAMLKAAGRSAAVANASSATKAVADMVMTKSNVACGVAELIYQL